MIQLFLLQIIKLGCLFTFFVYIFQHPNHRYPTHPHHDPSPIYSIGYPQRPLGPPHGYGGPPSRPFNPIQALRPPKFDLFGFLNLEKNDQIYPGTQPLYAEEEESGFFDPLLSLIGKSFFTK